MCPILPAVRTRRSVSGLGFGVAGVHNVGYETVRNGSELRRFLTASV